MSYKTYSYSQSYSSKSTNNGENYEIKSYKSSEKIGKKPKKEEHSLLVSIKNTNITKIPKWVYTFKNMTKLNLADNQLTSLPETLLNFKDLKEIDITNNPIKSLNNTICRAWEEKQLKIISDKSFKDLC